MQIMKWQDITVEQFQMLSELWQGADLNDPAIAFDMVGICYNLTPHQVDSMSVADMSELIKGLAFLNEIPDWKPVRFVDVNGRRYRFVYDVRQIHAARNIEVKHFSQEGVIQAMHKMAASMVIPQRRNYFGQWKDVPYDSARHEQYAADLRQAPITAIHGSALFFCGVFTKLIEATADYLTSTIPENKRQEAKEALLSLCSSSDGSTTPLLLQSLSASPLIKPTTSHT